MGRHLPLVVTARLGAPVVTDGPMHLDSILTEAVGRRLGLLRADALRTDDPGRFTPINLPLDSVTLDGRTVWCASAETVDVKAAYQHWWVRRRDAEDEEAIARPFTPGAGPDRNMMLRRDGFSAFRARWFCIGHRREVRKALELVPAIGAKRAQGCGVVLSWTVEEGGNALSWLLSPEHTCRRQVPAGWLDETRHTTGAWMSPYFLDAYQEHVSRVGAPAALSPGLAAVLGQS